MGRPDNVAQVKADPAAVSCSASDTYWKGKLQPLEARVKKAEQNCEKPNYNWQNDGTPLWSSIADLMKAKRKQNAQWIDRNDPKFVYGRQAYHPGYINARKLLTRLAECRDKARDAAKERLVIRLNNRPPCPAVTPSPPQTKSNRTKKKGGVCGCGRSGTHYCSQSRCIGY